MASKYQIGDLVWAKMKGYCAWPSRICDPSESPVKRPSGNAKATKALHCVYFFGSNNYGWIAEDSLKPYEGDHKAKNINGSKSGAFKEALAVIDDYIKTGGRTETSTTPTTATTTTTSLTNSTNNNNNNNSAGGDTNNIADGLPTIDEEIATILNTSKKQSNDSQTSSPSHTTPNSSADTVSKSPISSSVQRDYSRTPFKSRKSIRGIDDSATDTVTASPTKRSKVEQSDNDSCAATTAASTFSPIKSPSSSTTTKSSTNKSSARNLLLKTPYLDAANLGSQPVNISSISAKSKSITPSNLKFGFLGLGLMGQRLLKNLLNSKHNVTIWNRSPDKCKEFVEAGAIKATTPSDVVLAADIIFSCLADPHASKEIVFGNCGILTEKNLSRKGFVEMSSIDPETSNDISEAIIACGGRYLEAPMICSGKKVAEEGKLTIICAGDKTLFEDCHSCFKAMGDHTFFLGGQIGNAMKMNLVVSMLYGTLVGVLAESMALTDRTGLQQKDLLDILKLSPLNCPLIETKASAIINNDFATEVPLSRLQKDLRLSLVLSEDHEQPVPIAAATNEVFKHAKRLGFQDHDASAVYLRSRY